MKNIILSIIFLTFSLCLSAQSSKKTDSLFTILKTAKADTTSIKTYNKFSWEYQSSNPDTALYFANSALKLSIKANYKKGMAMSYNNIGSIHDYKGDYVKAIEYYFKSLKIKEELGDKKGMSASYNNIGVVHENKGDYDKAIEYYFKSLKIKEELGDKKGMAASYNNIGIIHDYKGDYVKALEFYIKALNINKEMGNKNWLANNYNNIGNIHSNKGDYDKAIEFYYKCLKIREELGDKNGTASSYGNIGNIHTQKGDYDKALNFYFKSLKIREELGDKKGMSTSYNNIGIIHRNKGDYDKAIEFYFKSLKIDEELGDKNGIATSYNNIGSIHDDKGDYDKAIEFYFKSLKIRKEIGDKKGMSTSYNNIGNLYLIQSKIKEAKKQQLLALNIAKEIGAKNLIYYAYRSLAQCDSALGNFMGAYQYHKLYSQLHDSVFSKESDDKIAEMGAKYEAEKRELTIQKLEKEKLLQDETLARKEAESKKQRILLFSFLAGFIIILVFSVFLYRLFVQKKKANIILAQQKEEISAQRDEIETQRDLVTQQKEHIEHIHEEQTDSIRYAERIQRAVLPSDAYFNSILNNQLGIDELGIKNLKSENPILILNSQIPNYFVLFRPKDIVSGDFYFIAQRKNTLLIAVADCTGHGVPGAFMSMLGISFLNEIIAKEEIQSASHVLNELRQYVINSLQQKGMVGEQQDGMDIAFIALNTETLELQYAGANNPCYIIKPFENETTNSFPNFQDLSRTSFGINAFPNLVELKGDKMPIGIYSKIQPFTNQIFQLQKNDTIYLMSDGYEDQFGGPNRKKFLAKNLKNLLMANSQKPMADQKQILETNLAEWIGTGEQIDDITVMGIRI